MSQKIEDLNQFMEDQTFNVGTEVDTVKVSIGPRFLNLFSEHLYTSPNKAFEELVSNSWDAGASNVYIKIPQDLEHQQAAIWVLDDGHSMDTIGLQNLWSVATSFKRDKEVTEEGRKPIGKFGVGKLATYLLADQLTYICKSSDGVIRSVTMDYRKIDALGEENQLHIDNMELKVRSLSMTELKELVLSFDLGQSVYDLIGESKVIPIPNTASYEDEFGKTGETLKKASDSTWTIAILSHLKKAGKGIQIGWIRRMLITALPLGNTIKIKLNDEVLAAKKSNTALIKEWTIGDDLPVTGIEVELDDSTTQDIKVENHKTPFPHASIDGIGPITGTVKLYEDSIAGGKSEIIEISNGFFINIRGRIIKLDDPYFGLKNLSHGTWSQFRATVRADGLDKFLSVNRDDISKSFELKVFQRFLLKLFNIARTEFQSREARAWPNAGEILTEKWGNAPLEPLEKAVEDSLESSLPLLSFIQVDHTKDKSTTLANWKKEIEADPSKIISSVIIDENVSKDERLVKYNVADKQIIINANHPFAVEHSGDAVLRQLLSDTALVDLLANAYAANIGVTNDQIEEIELYRDRAYRLVAHVRRQTASQIINLLDDAKEHDKGFEVIIGDALEYLGYSIKRLGASGEPEGVATAFVTPRKDAEKVIYKFTYDAKSTGKDKASTQNLNIAGLERHKNDHKADFSLVIARDFRSGALQKEAKNCGITPIRTTDLSTLLRLTIGFGPISLETLKEIFNHHDPDDVHKWVEALKLNLEQNSQKISFDTLITALENIVKDNPETPDCIHASVLAVECRNLISNKTSPTDRDIRAILNGLSILIPNVLTVDANGNIFINTDPKLIRDAIQVQLGKIKRTEKFGIVKGL